MALIDNYNGAPTLFIQPMPTKNDDEIVIVMTTITDIDKGKLLARQIIDEQLAACCNIVPKVTSIYRWRDELCEEQECLLVIKTAKFRFNQLSEFINKRHPYETPEIISIPITASSQEYQSWVIQETS